jgi:hypothetical protein
MFGRKHKKLAVALVCADWRLHQRKVSLSAMLAGFLKVDGVDLIAVPGPDGLLKPERANEQQSATGQISLLAGVHSPITLAVVAHQKCAGHPVSDHDHETDSMATARALKAATKFTGPVIAAVVVYHSDTNWSLKKVGEC